MACKPGSDTSKCLNKAQIAALRLAYSDYNLETIGGDNWVAAGMDFGQEKNAAKIGGLFGEKPFLPTIEYFR